MNSNELCTFQKRLLIIVPAYELLLRVWIDVQNQLVCRLHYSWCWSTPHVQLALKWLQLSTNLQYNVRGYDHNNLAYLHPLRSAGAIECVSSVVSWCNHECRSIILIINAINGHSFLQHTFNTTDVTFNCCIMEVEIEIFVDFYGRNS